MARSFRSLASTLLVLLSISQQALCKGTLSLGIEKRVVSGEHSLVSRGLYKRQESSAGTVESTVFDVLPWSTGGAYYTNITVGTPPQTLTVILDTGSSDLYVDASSSQACEDTSSSKTCRGGSFNPGASSTYKVAQQGGFNTSFGDGSTAAGDLGTDVVVIGDVSLTGVQFGVATNVVSTVGYAVSLVGIGYDQNEAGTNKYPNMPDLLASSGAINSRLYSVYLNDQGDATGTILFGGIDTSKYDGPLHTLNLLPYQAPGSSESLVFQFLVAVTGFQIAASGKTQTILEGGDPTGESSNSLPVLLDTGSSAWSVPSSWYKAVADAFGNSVDRNGFLPCSHQNDNVTLTVEFGGQVSINVPAESFVTPLYDPTTNKPVTDNSGNAVCSLGVVADTGTLAQAGFVTLGDAVLRHMYVVFDMDNGQVSIAPANLKAASDPSSSGSGDNIKVVKAGVSGVAEAVGSANSGVSTTASNTNSIAAAITPSQSISFATASPPAGTATGTDAAPVDGRLVTGTAASGGSSGSGSPAATSKGASSSGPVPPLNLANTFVCALWIGMSFLGLAIIL